MTRRFYNVLDVTRQKKERVYYFLSYDFKDSQGDKEAPKRKAVLEVLKEFTDTFEVSEERAIQLQDTFWLVSEEFGEAIKEELREDKKLFKQKLDGNDSCYLIKTTNEEVYAKYGDKKSVKEWLCDSVK